ncbi:hypothetical protein PM082_011754 [Marasmius tenuissimus]|nr:hypothetical protein PM082_011754 [Marasmius tenuissimus]
MGDTSSTPSSSDSAVPSVGGTLRSFASRVKEWAEWPGNATEATIATLVAVQKTVPVPGLGSVCLTLAELLRAVDDTKENKKAFGRLADEAIKMTEVIMKGCKVATDSESRNQTNSAATISQLNAHAEAFNGILEEIKDEIKKKEKLSAPQRFWTSRKDLGLVQQWREKLNAAVDRFQTECNISHLKALDRVENKLDTLISARRTEREVLTASESDSFHDVVEPAPQITFTGSEAHGIPQSHTPPRGFVPNHGDKPTTVSTPGSRPPSSSGRTESSNPQSHSPAASLFDGGRDPSSATGRSSPFSDAKDTAASSGSPPISRTSSNPFNPFRSRGTPPVSQSPSPTPSSMPHSAPTPAPNPFLQPQSPPRSQNSSPSSMSILQGSSGVSIGGNITMNSVVGNQNNSYTSPATHHVSNSGNVYYNTNSNNGNAYYNANSSWGAPNPTYESNAHHHHHHSTGAYPHPFPSPHPQPYGWRSPPPPGSWHPY